MQFEGEGHRTIEKDEIVTTVYCNKYKMSFPHDFCDDSVEEYDKVIEKYGLRIKRFASLLNSDKKILLVFKPEQEESSAQWIDQLDLIIRSKYTSASFYFCSVQELKAGLSGNWKVALKIQLKRKIQRINQAVRRVLNFRFNFVFRIYNN